MLKIKENITALMEKKTGQPVKSSVFASVIKFSDRDTGKSYYYKEFIDRGIKDTVKNLFGLARCRRAFTAGYLLLKEGFLTPEPVLFGIEKRFLHIRKNFMITRAVEGERTYEYIKNRYPLPLSAGRIKEKRTMLQAAGKEIGRLHKSGVSHGDLRAGNILISGFGESARFYFIDNERTKVRKAIPEKKRLKNLVQLNMTGLPHITGTDRLRFLNSYISVNPELGKHREELLKKVAALTIQRKQKKS